MSMKRVVIFTRVSSVGNRQNTKRQIHDLTRFALGIHGEIVKVFSEHISGAKKNEERPVLQECLEFCEANGIDCLLISELSRLGRSTDEVLATVRRCTNNRLNIYFQKEGLSLFQADGKKNPFLNVFISVLSTCAELERENIQFRLNSGRRRYIEAGGACGRPKGTNKSAEKKQEEYKQVLKLLKNGMSVRKTAKLTDTSASTVARLKKEFQL